MIRRRKRPGAAAHETRGRPAIRRVLSNLRQRLEVLYGPRLVRLVLYGSQARGDARRGSDVDVLVVLRGPVDPATEIARVGPTTADLSLAAGVVLSCQFVSDERFATEQSPLLMNVRREGVTL